MSTPLTSNEEHYLNIFLDSVSKKTAPPFAFLYISIITILGLVLLSAAVIITLNNLNDKTIYWVFFPGFTSGIGIILLGVFLQKYLNKVKENIKLASIIKKLL